MARSGFPATHGAASTPQSLQTLAVGAIVVAALYFARDVLIPLALALLLTFLLAPAVLRLRRGGLGRHPGRDADALLASLDAALGRRTEARAEGWSLLSVDLATDVGRTSAHHPSDTPLAMRETLETERR